MKDIVTAEIGEDFSLTSYSNGDLNDMVGDYLVSHDIFLTDAEEDILCEEIFNQFI